MDVRMLITNDDHHEIRRRSHEHTRKNPLLPRRNSNNTKLRRWSSTKRCDDSKRCFPWANVSPKRIAVKDASNTVGCLCLLTDAASQGGRCPLLGANVAGGSYICIHTNGMQQLLTVWSTTMHVDIQNTGTNTYVNKPLKLDKLDNMLVET